jgi:hypothetical protein
MRIVPLSRATATPKKWGVSSKPSFSFPFHSVALLVFTSCPVLFAQNIQIKLLNGKSGRPIAGAIHSQAGGVCGAFGVVDPVVKYADTIRVNVGYVSCASHKSDFSWLATTGVPTKDLIEQGIVTPNTCGRPSASQKPGELTIFVRPLTFWEKLKQ